jgi:hypothetical protein
VTSRRRIEVLLRLALVVLVLVAFPPNFVYDVRYYWLHAHGLSFGHLPYRDFLWEYPPLAALPLLLVPLSGGAYNAFLLLFVTTMVGVEYACLVVLRRAWPDQALAITVWWHALALPLATIAWFRLDFLAVLPATCVLISLDRGRRGGGALVAGVAAKLWPGVLALGLIARREWRQLAIAAGGTTAMVAVWVAWSPAGLRAFLRYRRGSGLQIESLGGSVLRLLGHKPVYVSGSWVMEPGHWGWVEPALMTALALAGVAVAVGVGRFRVSAAAMPEFLGAAVIGLLLAARLLSPQFLVWALPFVVVVAARGGKRQGQLFAAAIGLTLVTNWSYTDLVFGAGWHALPVVARNAVLVVLAASLVRRALRMPAHSASHPAVATVSGAGNDGGAAS